MSDTFFYLLELCCLSGIAFLLLYPFYLRERDASHFRWFWQSITGCFKSRHNACLLLFTLTGIMIANTTARCTQSLSKGFLIAIIYILLVYPVVFWYPRHLYKNNTEKYAGIWKSIGDWLEGPKSPFS